MSAPPLATRGRPSLIVALIACVIAFALQQTAIVPAIGDVQQSLHAGKEWTAWLVTVYLMVATVATPVMGRLADLYGRRRMLLAGLLVFGLGSVGAACAPGLAVLLVFRSVQGVGGAVYPLALALGRDAADGDQEGRTIALLAGSFGVGSAVGFASGGALADFVTWRAVFVLGAVLVVLAGSAVLKWIGPDTGRASGGFDTVGTGFLSVASIGLLMGLTLVVTLGPGSFGTVIALALAVAAAVLWVRHELRAENPIVDLHVLTSPAVAAANLATFGLGWAMFSSFLLIPEFARTPPTQVGYGLAASGFMVGILLVPQAVGQAVTAALAGTITALPPRLVFATGLLAVTASEILLAFIRRDPWMVGGAMLLLGAGGGLAMEAASSITTRGVRDDVAAASASLNSTVRRLAGGLGGQISTLILAALVAGGGQYPSFGGFVVGYLIACGLCVGGAIAVGLRKADDGSSAQPAAAQHG